ncbi:SRPBCC family protein [Candidatus Nomurabacteria bacterium]|nr:SRPBCC family protein [Candidatus Nomurabacteria bacterium]
MTKLHHEIKINAPVKKVWLVLADLELVRFTNPLVMTVKIISPNKKGVGSARHCDFKDGKFVEERITAFEPNRLISFELYKHQWPLVFMRWTNKLEKHDDATLLISDTEYELKFGPLGKILNVLIMRRKFNQIIASALNDTKRYIEENK